MYDVVEDFKQAYEQVQNLPYLIIDVRHNGGGNSGNQLIQLGGVFNSSADISSIRLLSFSIITST